MKKNPLESTWQLKTVGEYLKLFYCQLPCITIMIIINFSTKSDGVIFYKNKRIKKQLSVKMAHCPNYIKL